MKEIQETIDRLERIKDEIEFSERNLAKLEAKWLNSDVLIGDYTNKPNVPEALVDCIKDMMKDYYQMAIEAKKQELSTIIKL